MRNAYSFVHPKVPVIPRSAEGATWGPSFICVKLKINLKEVG
jgi:hypothetical protein